jgi:hypothetical protein
MDQPEEPFEVDDFSAVARQMQRPIQPLIHAEHLRQAKIAFNAALTIGILGIFFLFGGVGVFIYRGFGAGSGITVAAGIIMDVLSFFLIKFLGQTVTRLDQIRRDENAMGLVRLIQDQPKRDEAICELIKTLGKKPQKN